jgi:hypothetical protein
LPGGVGNLKFEISDLETAPRDLLGAATFLIEVAERKNAVKMPALRLTDCFLFLFSDGATEIDLRRPVGVSDFPYKSC